MNEPAKESLAKVFPESFWQGGRLPPNVRQVRPGCFTVMRVRNPDEAVAILYRNNQLRDAVNNALSSQPEKVTLGEAKEQVERFRKARA